MVMVLTLVNLAPDTRHVVMAEAARRTSAVLRTKQHSRKSTKGRKMGTRVLVVDDSITMRALFTDVLERSSGISVVGAAANADEARDMIAELKPDVLRSEEHTSELQSLMRISYAVFCLKNKNNQKRN